LLIGLEFFIDLAVDVKFSRRENYQPFDRDRRALASAVLVIAAIGLGSWLPFFVLFFTPSPRVGQGLAQLRETADYFFNPAKLLH